MKTVLIIAYHALPDPGVGALRPDGLINYLKEFGWQPILLTTKMDDERRSSLYKDVPVYECQSFDVMHFLRRPLSLGLTEDKTRFQMPVFSSNHVSKPMSEKLKHFIKCCTAFPDRHNGWWFVASKLAKRIIKENDVDLIISTSPPWTSALVGASISRSENVPWIADCRDLWSQYHRYDFGSMRLKLDRCLERRTLNRAAAIVVVSSQRAEKLQKINKRVRIESITLGFDPMHFDSIRVSPNRDTFILTHVGKLKGQQNARPLFSALAEAFNEGMLPRERIKVHFWGPVEQEQKQFASELGLENVVSFLNLVPREEVLKSEMLSQLLLLFSWNDPNEPGIHPGKLFDYLGARRPILAIGNQKDVAADVVIETNSGSHFSSIVDIKKFLCNAYETFERTGQIAFEGDKSAIEKYTYREITRKYATLMDSVVQSLSHY